MRQGRLSLRRPWRRQDGFTLIELLVAAVVTLIVAAGAMAFFAIAIRQHNVTSDRVTTLDRSREAFERMVREVRQSVNAALLSTSSVQGSFEGSFTRGTAIELRLWQRTSPGSATSPSALQTVRYDCGVAAGEGRYACTRRNVTIGSPETTVVSGITNTDPFRVVFSAATDNVASGASVPLRDRFVRIHLALQPPGAGRPLPLRGGATSRNCLDDTPGILSAMPCES